VSVLLHPLQVGSAPLLWRDWSRRDHRRACMQLVRHQRLEMNLSPPAASPPIVDVQLGKLRSGCSASQQPLPPRSVWRQPNLVLATDGVLLLGQADFSEGSLMPPFLVWFSLLPLCGLFRSPSRQFGRL
jgi:hypothetical protein